MSTHLGNGDASVIRCAEWPELHRAPLRILLPILLPILLMALAGGASGLESAASDTVRVGVLKFGTVNWELDVVRAHGLDRANGFDLQVIEYGSPAATVIALQGGAVDIVVTDWLWVAQQWQKSRSYRYFPFSTAVGELVVAAKAGVDSPTDLRGKVLGVAGGASDKNWLLYRAYTIEKYGFDLKGAVEQKFAAPPLLNGLARHGRLDGVLNYWHYSCILLAEGHRSLVNIGQVLGAFGIESPVPMLGWVFRDDWGRSQASLVNRFLAASYQAKALMLASENEWQRLRPRMKAANDGIYNCLREGFRNGIPRRFDNGDIDAIRKVSELLARQAGDEADFSVPPLNPALFWRDFRIGE